MYGKTAGAALLAGLSPRVLSRLSVFYGAFVLRHAAARDVEPLRRAIPGADTVAPAGSAARDAGALAAGLGVAVPVMYVGAASASVAPPMPTPLETALARFCALVVSVASAGHRRRAGRRPAAPPDLGLLYSDDDSKLGCASGNVAYVNARGEVARARRGGGAAAVAPMLEALAKTALHEAAHVMVDPNENHSRAFWDAHVDMCGDFAVHGACAALRAMLTGRGASTLEGALAVITAVLAQDCESAERAAARERRKRKRGSHVG